mmetsp:Transcript_36548/g.84298  ORF Transcript_36548/g.84298 Transcript_36548/m.84298 type:complete len:172 (-) Transcript_36548:60-575(-)
MALPGCEEIVDWSVVRNVMVQNLPARLTQEELMTAVEELGFLGYMNYFHLPQKSHGQSRNHGYAFLGFVTPEVAGRFRDAMTGYSFKTRPSPKQVVVRPARLQNQHDHVKGDYLLEVRSKNKMGAWLDLPLSPPLPQKLSLAISRPQSYAGSGSDSPESTVICGVLDRISL